MLPSPPSQDWEEESEDRTPSQSNGQVQVGKVSCGLHGGEVSQHSQGWVPKRRLLIRLYTFSPVRHPQALDTGEVGNGGGGGTVLLSQGLASMQEGISTHRLQRGNRHV